jgi:hypothetical protein
MEINPCYSSTEYQSSIGEADAGNTKAAWDMRPWTDVVVLCQYLPRRGCKDFGAAGADGQRARTMTEGRQQEHGVVNRVFHALQF